MIVEADGFIQTRRVHCDEGAERASAGRPYSDARASRWQWRVDEERVGEMQAAWSTSRMLVSARRKVSRLRLDTSGVAVRGARW